MLKELFIQYAGFSPDSIEELPSSGSNRRYFRLKRKGISLIGTIGTCIDENIAFLTIAEDFYNKGLPVPKVLAVSQDKSCYLQEDLGDVTLFSAISLGRELGTYSEKEKELLFKTVATLPRLQFEGAKGLDFNVCYPQPEFDRRMISFDLNYFKYCFLKATGIEFSEIKLEDDFARLSDFLMKTMSDTFLYRDFQARNVMIVDGNPYFIDFQGGRKGPVYYDVASFIWQAKANYSDELREALVDKYIEALSVYRPVDKDEFWATLRHFIL
ncbi:MAG: phosphotransferase, partial [Bacteroidales bacterium]|nr:phosphotransferase [Bacteroidales bacterium]